MIQLVISVKDVLLAVSILVIRREQASTFDGLVVFLQWLQLWIEICDELVDRFGIVAQLVQFSFVCCL